MNMIEIDNLSVCYKVSNKRIDNIKEYFIQKIKRQIYTENFWALKDINITIKEGEAVGIIGLNGSGKSTLLKVVSGIIFPISGKVVNHGKIAPLIELGAGFDLDLTARENIFLNGAVLGYKRKFLKTKVDDIIKFAELDDFVEVPVKNYSSGMVARLGFSIATMVQPDILILDEVLSVGDYQFQEKSLERTREIINNGATVLFVSHSLNQLRAVCDRIIWIEQGQIKMDGGLEVLDIYEKSRRK